MSDAETQGFLTIWALGSGGVVFAASMYLLRYWARPGQNKFAQVTIVFSWFLAFAVCFILPVDFVPSSDKTALDVVWRFIWWLSFLLCWIIIPLVSDYTTAGEFTFGGRLKYAIRFNLCFYGVLGVIFIVLLVVIAIQNSLSNDQVGYLITCIANIFGLVLVVLLLGYGVVELPRSIWRRTTDRRVRLRMVHYQLAAQALDYDDAKIELHQVHTYIEGLTRQIDGNHPLRRYLDEVRGNCPPIDDFDMGDVRHQPANSNEKLNELKQMEVSEKMLAKLNFYTKETDRYIFLARGLFQASCDEAIRLENQIRERAAAPVNTARGRLNRFCWSLKNDTVPTLQKMLAIVCAVMSFMVVWGELMIPVSGGWSPIGALLGSLRTNASWMVPLVGDIWLGYQMACCCLGMFIFRIPKIYQMAKKNSDAYSMLFNALNVGRFWAPMAYNFTALMKLDDTSGFQDVMGPMSNIPLLGSSLDLILPLFVPFLALIVVLNLHVRIARCFSIRGFDYSAAAAPSLRDEDMATEIADGKNALRREKRRRGLPVDRDVDSQV